VLFNIAYEAWSEGQAPDIGPTGNVFRPGFFDTNAASWAAFRQVRGIGRLLHIAEKHQIKTSVMASGVLCVRDPKTLKRLVELGHELVNHCWGMDVIPVYLDEATERANLQRSHELLARTTDVAPTGWISPRGTGSLITSSLLAQAGYTHHGDVNGDELAYVMEFDSGRIVGIPLTMEVNDLPICIRYSHAPRHMLEVCQDTFSTMRERESVPLMLDVTAHAHVMDRASGAWVYDSIMEVVKKAPDVRICTRAQIARHVLDNTPE
jgi:hypothetical protein